MYISEGTFQQLQNMTEKDFKIFYLNVIYPTGFLASINQAEHQNDCFNKFVDLLLAKTPPDKQKLLACLLCRDFAGERREAEVNDLFRTRTDAQDLPELALQVLEPYIPNLNALAVGHSTHPGTNSGRPM